MSKRYLIEGNKKLDFRMEDDSKEMTVYLYGRVYSWLAEDFAYLHSKAVVDGIETIHLRINSLGGDVFAGNAIYNLLKSSKINIITYNDGVAASMSSIILLSGNKVKMAESAVVMIHNPSGGCWGESDEMRSCADMLDKLRDVMAAQYANRTKEDLDQVKANMKKETWYNSEEALASGLIDEIYNSEIVPLEDSSTEMNADQMYHHFAAQLGSKISIPKTKNNLQKTDMEISKLAISLGLPHDASEADVQKRLSEIKAQASTAEDLKNEVAKQKQAQVKLLIDGAISDGKITEAQRQLYTGNAMNDFETTSAMLQAMSPALKPNDIIGKSKGFTSAQAADKKFTDLSKEEVEALRKDDWEGYVKMFSAHFGYKPQKTKLVELSE